MLKALYTLSILLFFCSCVSTHPGTKAKSNVKGDTLVVSSENVRGLSDKYYLFLEYTFENKSDEWKDVHVKRLAFAGEKSTEILVNDRLSAWIEGAELKMRKNNYNTAVILGSIAAVGGALGALSNDGNLQVAGFAALAGAGAVGTYQEIARERQVVGSGAEVRPGTNQVVYIPKKYILAPFKVAPGSYVKRWVVLRKPRDFGQIAQGTGSPKARNRFKQDIWKDAWDSDGDTSLIRSKLISEIEQNKQTNVYTTKF